MNHEEGDACVYVKESVLRELEQERRRLKWQLSRALQTSDARAAELEASKAKVKDLLTIVEVNKGVADQVVQRSRGRDARRIAELETLTQQSKQQRQRYVDLALRLMNRRVRDRQQRNAFHSLQQAVLVCAQRREAILRLLARIRWRALRRGLKRWKRLCCFHEHGGAGGYNTGSAKVHPLSQDQLSTSEAVFMGALSPPLSMYPRYFNGNDSPRQFLRWKLLRKVWRNWERVVRWKRRHREFMKVNSRRLQRLIFVTWKSRARVLRQRRVLLRRIFQRTNWRIQQLGLTALRLRCAEVSAHDWAEVLKAAHAAMEEERKLRTEVQASAASELHTAYIREQHRQQRFTELQTQRLEDFKRRERKHRTLMMLRCEVIRSRQKNAIALRFLRLQHHQLVTRKLFTSWRREASHRRRIKSTITAWDNRRTHYRKVNCFRLFAWTLQRKRQRRLQVFALIAKLRRTWLLKGWLCLRIRSAIEEHKAIAHVEKWQFSQKVEAMKATYGDVIQRSKKVALKYQVTCALLMADKNHEKCLRWVFRTWSKHSALNTRQRRALRRLIARRRSKTLRAAMQKWVMVGEGEITRHNQMEQYQLSRLHRLAKTSFSAWKRNTQDKLRSRLACHQQRSCLHAWRHWLYLRRRRTRWLGRLLQRMVEKRERHAFQSWKRKLDHYVTVSTKRKQVEYELISRLWRRWIGFVASRLRAQRSQQKKAFIGVRSAMQRTILTTAFTSWQTTWKQTQSREKMIVRALRANTCRARVKQYLRGWHHHSALMGQRRSALKRICRQQNLRKLQNKWYHWIRVSLCATITTLETLSIKAHQRVESVVQSTKRINTLRRTFRQWRLASAASVRNQHRRALFAEKRRYMTLLATLRQWNKRITCFPLSKQRRMLRRLVNMLRLSTERRAFSYWERKAHNKTLIERDRISAELFHRSEIRVMALAEEVRAKRERRIIFTSWRSITRRKKNACEKLQSILLKHQHRLQHDAWGTWTLYSQTQRCVIGLMKMVNQRLKAAAWCKLMQVYRHHELRSTGAQRAVFLWHRIMVRHTWNHWKRSDSTLSKHAALTQATASSIKSMLSFKMVIARRHYKKRCQTTVLTAWKQHVTSTKRLQRRLRDILGKRAEGATAYHFQRWRNVVQRENDLQQLLCRVIKRLQVRDARLALDRWRRWLLEMMHQQLLEQSKQAILRQREESARRIAAAKFLSWQRPCLETHFVRWRILVEQCRQYVVEKRVNITNRRKRHLLQSVWLSWSDMVSQSKRRIHLIAKALNNMHHGLLTYGFYRWDQWSSYMRGVDRIVARLIRTHELWQWRRGFAALRQHHREVIRRQSVMTASAFSAHSARLREQQIKLMRSVALVVQRKSSTALCGRCFRPWILYVKARVKLQSMIRLARVRSQKRIARRFFIEWQLHSQRTITSRQKVLRRQQVWECRRLRRLWDLWALFTQHSQDVKHLIYDRLIICALQHSLQGAWGRWKIHTKHVNGVLEAQRVSQWEHASAEREKVMSTLENKHERLLLRAAQLGQQNNALRQQLVSSASRTIHRLVGLKQKSRITTAFGVWKHKLRQVQALQTEMRALAARRQRLGLYHWRSATLQLRSAHEVTRAQLDASEWVARVVHKCAVQWLKRRMFASWKQFARDCRATKRCVAVFKCRHQHRLVQSCWVNWKRVLNMRAQQEDAVFAAQGKIKLKMLLQAYSGWRRGYERTGLAKHSAIRTLLLLRRAWQHRLLIQGWNRWRMFTIEADAAMLHTNLVLAELKYEKATDQQYCSQLLESTFSNWKLYTRNRCTVRGGYARVFAVASRHRLLYTHFAGWKHSVAFHQKRLLHTSRMMRHLQRHHVALTRFALWVWFIRVQTESRWLTRMKAQLQVALKQFTPAADVRASIVRALLTNLHLKERQFIRSQQRSAWRVVNATVRSARRQQLRAAFNRLTSGTAVRNKHRLLTQTHVANARAFVDKLALIVLRSGFQRWKEQYIALALQEAEEAQQELLRALHHVTSYRQALDPYIKQR